MWLSMSLSAIVGKSMMVIIIILTMADLVNSANYMTLYMCRVILLS